jgi:hypothetical protein
MGKTSLSPNIGKARTAMPFGSFIKKYIRGEEDPDKIMDKVKEPDNSFKGKPANDAVNDKDNGLICWQNERAIPLCMFVEFSGWMDGNFQ